MTFFLYNTLGRTKQEFIPLKKGEVSFYTCGPTVYNYAHIGNFRAYLSADILRRWLQFGHKYQVKWVLNITDVDDKTIRDSKEKYKKLDPKEALQKFTRYYEEVFMEDLETLAIQKSDFYANPRATDYIAAMQDLIRKISENGFAKEVDGSIYFDVKKWAEADKYGKLLDLDLSSLKSGTRTLADEVEKEDLSDFALWKGKKTGEPFWDFDFFGKNIPGRPGWHLECSAMEKEIFDLPFDIHSGGVDLVFPHHEDEIAQSKCGYSVEPTKYWMHNEHLMVEGKKMSKSLGNFFTLRDLIQKGHDPEVVRFFLVTNHYRTKLNISKESLVSAKNSLKKMRSIIKNISLKGENKSHQSRHQDIFQIISQKKIEFIDAMNDDLNAPRAIAALHTLLSEIKGFDFTKQEKKELFHFLHFASDVFGVSFFEEKTSIPDEIRELAEQRRHARAGKNWQRSDELRDDILEKGFLIKDNPDGSYEIEKK